MKTRKKTNRTATALLLAGAMALLPISPSDAATDEEFEELRELVLSLAQEVDSLKQQLAEKEASRDVPELSKPESDSSARKPIEKPTVASVSSKYGLGFYGYFKLDALHNSGLTSHQEIPFWVRPDTGTNGGSFDMTAKETRLGMNFAGPEVAGGKVTGKLELDFYGNINTPASLSTNHAFAPRSRHAYINWDFGDWSLLAGKTWEPYIIEIPQTLNFSYYNFMGQLGLRKTQLRATKKIGEGTELIGAFLEPVGGVHGADLDGDLQDDASDAEFPVISGKFLQKIPSLTDKPGRFGISFVYGQENIDLPPVGDRTNYDAWAVVSAFNLPLTDWLAWKSSIYTGENLDSYWGNIGQGINLAAQTEIAGQGGWSQLQFKPNEKNSLNIGFSVDNPADKDLSAGGRTRNESYLINYYHSFHPSLLFGIEYMKQKTGYKGSDTAENDHVHSSLIYKF